MKLCVQCQDRERERAALLLYLSLIFASNVTFCLRYFIGTKIQTFMYNHKFLTAIPHILQMHTLSEGHHDEEY